MGCGASKARQENQLTSRLIGNTFINSISVSARATSAAASGFGRTMARQGTRVLENGIISIRTHASTVVPDNTRSIADMAATAAIPQELDKYCALLRCVRLFSEMGDDEVKAAAREMQVRHFKEGEVIYDQGSEGHDCWIVESGTVVAKQLIWSVTASNVKEWREMRTYKANTCFGERGLLRKEPRQAKMVCRTDVTAVLVSAESFVKCARITEEKERRIRKVALFETMLDNQVSVLAALIKVVRFVDGEGIASQGQPTTCLYIVEEGEAVATQGGQEVCRYKRGSSFGEQVLLGPTQNEHTVTAVGDVVMYSIDRDAFESKFGSLSRLQAEQFAADPRKLLSDFYKAGDDRGPAGLLDAKQLTPRASGKTDWFAVYRPCSRDSIAKMLGTTGVGKGLNIKGKSAKKNRLSGFVPFLQISDNSHKGLVEQSPRNARTQIYYRNVVARQAALNLLTEVMRGQEPQLDIEEPTIYEIHDHEPKAFGLDVPEPVVREAYIQQPDLTPIIGWETGRASEPAFMDMNLHSVRGGSQPNVCLYQYDLSDPMNPHGLLIAYAESAVKPVISDFDTFTVGSRGMSYEPIDAEQVDLINWSLTHTQNLLEKKTDKGWMARWLEVLKSEARKGFHPTLPKFGFGDPTSYSLIGEVVECTSACGAVRHGAECFNFYFPQDLDDEFLVVWDGFSNPPWRAHSEPELRQFLLDRCRDGYCFPLNPVWPVRNRGWYEVLKALEANADGQRNLKAWFPPDSGILAKVEELHAAHPDGFQVVENVKMSAMTQKYKSAKDVLNAMQDLSTLEMANFVDSQVSKEVKMRWKRVRNAFRVEAMHRRIARMALARKEAEVS